MRAHAFALAVFACSANAQVVAPTPTSSSRGFFLLDWEVAPSAANMSSPRYVLDAGTASGVAAGSASSISFRLLGGFQASRGAGLYTQPWLSGARPEYTDLGSRTSHSIWGKVLLSGSSTTITVGTVAATVLARTNPVCDVALGGQTEPGWMPIVVRNGAGDVRLDRGIGVRPLLELSQPADPNGTRGGTIRFRGTTGDVLVWLMAVQRAPFPLKLPGYGWHLQLDLSRLLVLSASVVTDPNGTLALPLPPVRFLRQPLFQALVLSRSSSYLPGSFTNTLGL